MKMENHYIAVKKNGNIIKQKQKKNLAIQNLFHLIENIKNADFAQIY